MKVIDIEDKFGNRICLTRERWNHALKHKIPNLDHLESCLQNPVEVRKSKYDEDARLYYRKLGGEYVCVVVQIEDGFIMTAYTTEGMKEGETVWKQKK